MRVHWILWAVGTLGVIAGIWLIIENGPPFWAEVSMADHFWIHQLRMEWMPFIGILAIVSPLVALAALLFRFGRQGALALVFFAALAQFTYVGFEMYLKATEEQWRGEPPGNMQGWPPKL